MDKYLEILLYIFFILLSMDFIFGLYQVWKGKYESRVFSLLLSTFAVYKLIDADPDSTEVRKVKVTASIYYIGDLMFLILNFLTVGERIFLSIVPLFLFWSIAPYFFKKKIDEIVENINEQEEQKA